MVDCVISTCISIEKTAESLQELRLILHFQKFKFRCHKDAKRLKLQSPNCKQTLCQNLNITIINIIFYELKNTPCRPI